MLKRFHVRWMLVFYDILIFCGTELILLSLYNPSPVKNPLYHSLVGFGCVFLFRFLFRIYNQIWRYGSIQSHIRLLISDFCAFLLILILEHTVFSTRLIFPRLLSISCINLLGASTIRMCYSYAYRYCGEQTGFAKFLRFVLLVFAGKKATHSISAEMTKIPIAIIGAGRIGSSLSEELRNSETSRHIPRCFIDIDEKKAGRTINNLPVYPVAPATIEKLHRLGIQEVVLAIHDLSDESKQRLYGVYAEAGFKVKLYDYPMAQTIGEKRRVREFDIEDLLFRKQNLVIDEKTTVYYKGKTIMITGGGGSIGSEICRQLAKMSPRQLVLVDIYENGAYDIQQELRIKYQGQIDVRVEIVSICNRAGLAKIFDEYRPDMVIHAAAHKHVPLMEKNCVEAIENNVFGTLNVVELSEEYHVKRFIMVSTDKAVNPTNIMGATKRLCEMIVSAHSQAGTDTIFSATRFGNVLGSAGSVIPLFKKQIAEGGPITITDKRIIRFFMTIPEASQLVLKSGMLAKNGELFVLDMGQPVKILDLAENMIKLAGLTPDIDIQIVETGLRPGEKLYEELLVNKDVLTKTEDSLIFIERENIISLSELAEKLEILRRAVQSGDNGTAREAIRNTVPTYHEPVKE